MNIQHYHASGEAGTGCAAAADWVVRIDSPVVFRHIRQHTGLSVGQYLIRLRQLHRLRERRLERSRLVTES